MRFLGEEWVFEFGFRRNGRRFPMFYRSRFSGAPSVTRTARKGKTVTGGELEPPCYGSVWPVVWGAGVRIPCLPDSHLYFCCE